MQVGMRRACPFQLPSRFERIGLFLFAGKKDLVQKIGSRIIGSSIYRETFEFFGIEEALDLNSDSSILFRDAS